MAKETTAKCVSAPSFGFGDRIGLATPGHVEAMKRAGAGIEALSPAVDSRNARTKRTAEDMMGSGDEGWLTLAGGCWANIASALARTRNVVDSARTMRIAYSIDHKCGLPDFQIC